MSKDPRNIWIDSFTEAERLLKEFAADPAQMKKCAEFANALVQTFKNGGNVFFCGNGGSHCDAMHAAEEFTGRFQKDRVAMGALALGDPSHVTCVSNDFGFDQVFARQLEGLGRKGDLLVTISTSGKSKNIANAIEVAKKKGIRTVALLGRDGGPQKDMADLNLIVPGKTSERVQEMHIKILHTAIEACERELY